MRTKMLQRRLEKLEAAALKDDAPSLVIYSWVSPKENREAETGTSEPLKQIADGPARGGAVDSSRKDPRLLPPAPPARRKYEEPEK